MPSTTFSKQFIVYADDDVDDLFLIEEAFEKFDASVEVLTFPDGWAALNYLLSLTEEQPMPCLILLDINMPRLNGKEVLAALRKTSQFDKTAIVLFTTSSQFHDQEFARQHNAGFITKPVAYGAVECIAQKLLSHCGSEA